MATILWRTPRLTGSPIFGRSGGAVCWALVPHKPRSVVQEAPRLLPFVLYPDVGSYLVRRAS